MDRKLASELTNQPNIMFGKFCRPVLRSGVPTFDPILFAPAPQRLMAHPKDLPRPSNAVFGEEGEEFRFARLGHTAIGAVSAGHG